MVQAAVRSAIDFTTADFRSRKWWLKLSWVLDRIEDLNAEQVHTLQHAQHVSVLDYRLIERGNKEAFDTHWDNANLRLRSVFSINFPWEKVSTKDQQKTEIGLLMDQWKKKFGDPNDPQVQAYYKTVAESLRRRSATASKEMFQEQNKLKDMVSKVMKGRKGKT